MTAVVELRPQNVARGISLIIVAALAISIQDVVFKLFSGELTLWQIFCLRGVLVIPMLFAALWVRSAQRGILEAALGKWPLLRSMFITASLLAFYAALPFSSLSTVGAANYIAPIFITLLSAYAIREPVGPLGWLGVCLGFAGVVVLLQPGTDAFSPWALLPIVGAASYALAHITTRARCQNVPVAALSLSQNIVMLLAGTVASVLMLWLQPQGTFADAYPYIFGAWSKVGLNDWLVLALLAGFAIINGMLLGGAYQTAPPAVVSTFEYSYLVFVAVWDILFFGIAPSVASVSGMVLIVVAGLLVLRRKST
ncbi:DMT family transporter [Mesorhizobium sp. B2-7-1]|uniref:DMT family transporter n=1 Tax=Mesorhizobium sp. B2-7-1 TaxID=2589909 RepID=UPI0015E300CA|nr:DMT family transporter [Mesorhizobium sp. B2-7-1]